MLNGLISGHGYPKTFQARNEAEQEERSIPIYFCFFLSIIYRIFLSALHREDRSFALILCVHLRSEICCMQTDFDRFLLYIMTT